MERLSVPSRWFVSGVLALGALVGAAFAAPISLDQDALSHPETIAAWLDEHGKAAERRIAQRYLAMGKAAQHRRDWGGAAKAFGESALFFPTPSALVGYADNRLRMLADVRRREKSGTSQRLADLSHAQALYRSGLAADERLKMLGPAALVQLRSDEACLSAYVESKASTPSAMTAKSCRPLGLYALR